MKQIEKDLTCVLEELAELKKEGKFNIRLENGDILQRLVRIIPEEGFDINARRHPLERELWKLGVPYYFYGDGIGKGKTGDLDYVLDLKKLRIVYPKRILNLQKF